MKKTVFGAVAACAGAPLLALGIGSAVASAAPPDLFGSSGFAPTPNALAAALASRDGRQPLVGPGGSIIGNGLDADPDTCDTHCGGGNGGLLLGNGGAGANGGRGGNAGLSSATAVPAATCRRRRRLLVTPRTANQVQNHHAGNDRAAHGGNGGALFGSGGAGGSGGDVQTKTNNATGGAGGAGGKSGLFGAGGVGGLGGNASSTGGGVPR